MKYLVKSLYSADETSSVSAIQTWAERVRLVIGEALFFTCWLKPRNSAYAQLEYFGGNLSNIVSASPVLADLKIAGSIASGVVEGFITDTEFFALGVLDHDGNTVYEANEAISVLQRAGFNVAKYRNTTKKGVREVIEFCLMNNEDDCDGVYITPTDKWVLPVLVSDKNKPGASLFYAFPPKQPATEEAVEEVPALAALASTEEETTTVKITFYGKLPLTKKQCAGAALAAGFALDNDNPNVVVRAKGNKLPSKYRDCAVTPKTITFNEFTTLLENAKKESN